MTNREPSWIEQLIEVGRDLGLDVPTTARQWAPDVQSSAPVVDTAPSGTRLIESSESLSREELAGFFESLAERVRGGEISFRTGGYSVNFDVPDRVDLDLAAVSQDHADGAEIELGIVVHWDASASQTHEARHSG